MQVVIFDLDDTLYKEIDFLKSAYREIASYATQRSVGCLVPAQTLEAKIYGVMLEAYEQGGNAFEALNAYLGVEIPMVELLQLYHEHVPRISLEENVRWTLNRLKAEGIRMGILSDGRELTQWNKVKALGLTEWIDERCIIINSSKENFKPNSYGYECVESAVRVLSNVDELSFIYVGDNLSKDFIYPKQKGWATICLKDDGRNIHHQDFETTSIDALPDRVIETICDLLTM